MPRPLRTDVSGLVSHVLKRSNTSAPPFEDDADYCLLTALLFSVPDKPNATKLTEVGILAWNSGP